MENIIVIGEIPKSYVKVFNDLNFNFLEYYDFKKKYLKTDELYEDVKKFKTFILDNNINKCIFLDHNLYANYFVNYSIIQRLAMGNFFKVSLFLPTSSQEEVKFFSICNYYFCENITNLSFEKDVTVSEIQIIEDLTYRKPTKYKFKQEFKLKVEKIKVFINNKINKKNSLFYIDKFNNKLFYSLNRVLNNEDYIQSMFTYFPVKENEELLKTMLKNTLI